MNQSIKRMLVLSSLMLSFISAGATTLYWSGDGTTQGGVGTWDTTNMRWSTNSSGGPFSSLWVNGNTNNAVFDTTAATVTVGEALTVNTLTTSVGAYTFSAGNKITFSGTDAGVNADHASGITFLSCNFGGSVLTKTGSGRLNLNNSNQTVTKFNVKGGFIEIAALNRLGTAPGTLRADYLTLDGGGFGSEVASPGIDLGATRGVKIGANDGYFGASSTADPIVVPAPIFGTNGGALRIGGPVFYSPFSGCVLHLSNPANSYDGATTVTSGSLVLDASNVLPDTTTLTLNGGDMDVLTNSETVAELVVTSSASAISATGGGGTFIATNGYDLQASGTIAAKLGGAAAMTKTTTGTVTLSGANTFTGGLTMSDAGVLLLGNNAALGAANSRVTLASGTLASTSATARTLTYTWTVNDDITLGQATTGTGTLTLAGAGSMNFGGGTRTITINNPSDVISAVITNGGLTKAGSGTLSLTGANTYTGTTTINDGILSISGSNNCPGATSVNAGKLFTTTASAGAGSYSVADGAAFSVKVASAGSSLNVSDLTTGTSTMEFDFAGLGFPTARVVNDTGAITVNGNTSVDVKGYATTGGPVTLLQYVGPRSGGSFIQGNLPPNITGTITDDTVNKKVILNVTAADSLVWVSDGSGSWEINNPFNLIWKLAIAGTPTNYQENVALVQGDVVRFDDTATGSTAVNILAPVSPYRVTVDNSAVDYVFGGDKVSGVVGGLTKSGSGTLTITNLANDYTGGTTLNAGAIELGNNSALGTGKLTINGGVIRSDGTTARTLSVATDLNGSVTLGDTVKTGDLTLSGVIAGAGSVTKVGSGVLSLTGSANTFTGGVTHNAGTLRVNSSTGLGTANFNLANGTTLSTSTTTARTLTYAFNVNGDITLGQVSGGTAALTLAGSVNLGGANRTITISNATDTISAVITNGGLTKTGSGTLVLSGNNLYTGNTTNIQGFLNIGNNTVATPFGDASSTLYLAGGNISTASGNRDAVPILNPIVMLTNTTFEGDTAAAGFRNFPINGQITTTAGTLTVKNTGTVDGIWNPRLHAGGLNFTRPIIIGVSGDPGGTQLSSYNTNGGGDQTFSGVISGYGTFSRGAAVAGTGGKTILTQANTYSGGTTVSDGTLLVNNTTGSGTGSGTVSVFTNGVLGGTGTIGGAVVVTNGGSISAGASAGTLTLTNGLNLSVGGTNVWELAVNSTNGLGVNFDLISLTHGNLALGGSSRLLVKFIGASTFPNTNNVFWQQTNRWKVIGLSGGATNSGLTVFSGVDGVSGNNAGGFTTSADTAGVYLTFTPGAQGVQAPPPVISPNVVGAGTTSAQVSWSSVAGATYKVQYKTNLNQVGWLDLTNLTASGTTTTIVDSTSPVPKERYYRVISP